MYCAKGLWMVDLIEKDISIDNAGISKATLQLLQAVDDAYRTILAKSSNIEEAKKLLHIIIAAMRPLTVK